MAYWLDSDKVDLEKFLDVTVIEGKLNLCQKVSTTGPHGLVTCMDSLGMLLTWIGSNDQFDKEMVKSTMAKIKAIKTTYQEDTRSTSAWLRTECDKQRSIRSYPYWIDFDRRSGLGKNVLTSPEIELEVIFLTFK